MMWECYKGIFLSHTLHCHHASPQTRVGLGVALKGPPYIGIGFRGGADPWSWGFIGWFSLLSSTLMKHSKDVLNYDFTLDIICMHVHKMVTWQTIDTCVWHGSVTGDGCLLTFQRKWRTQLIKNVIRRRDSRMAKVRAGMIELSIQPLYISFFNHGCSAIPSSCYLVKVWLLSSRAGGDGPVAPAWPEQYFFPLGTVLKDYSGTSE